MRIALLILALFIFSPSFSQMEACPVNINYSNNNFTHWFAFTGNFQKSSSRVPYTKKSYDTVSSLPTGTINATVIPEFALGSQGIQVISNPGTDVFGNFPTIPNINGYQYNYSMQIGSTNISSAQGGLFRGLGYTFSVPPGSANEPYTMTYAYAMVLESAPHISDQVPLFSANLTTAAGTIACADATYILPTIYQASTKTYVLDQTAALKQGFSLSFKPSPNNNGNANETLYRVWTKGWTEVTFDLAPYRGQQVTLTFQADNCVPSGHFAYAYVALRNTCDGLQISGNPIGCTNSTVTYSIPALAGANYTWTIPPSWKMVSDSLNIIQIIAGAQGGFITARENNSCADLTDTIAVSTSQPTVTGNLAGNNTVCAGNNTTALLLTGNIGSILKWISSTDGIQWSNITDTTTSYIAQNLTTTTHYKALVQNGAACTIDSSSDVMVIVNPISAGGSFNPNNVNICEGQNMAVSIILSNYTGSILNWQSSTDSVHWTNFTPTKNDAIYQIKNVFVPTTYRTIVKSGVCPADTSTLALVGIYNTPFPQATVSPADTTICFGTAAQFNANISIGTSYSWSNPSLIYNGGNGLISSTPLLIQAKSAPSKNTDYILTISNTGCPNLFTDTIHVNVLPAFTVNAGHDTMIVANQPLQLDAIVENATNMNFSWSPTTGLDNPYSPNPIATLASGIDSMKYTVTATNSLGCTAVDDLVITIFKTTPEIFVPSAFTPNGDGRNDILKPITVGIRQLEFFSVYNRWGQLLYSTSEIGKGWDGNANGTKQQSGTYVYATQGIDYKGNPIFRKGTVVLIR